MDRNGFPSSMSNTMIRGDVYKYVRPWYHVGPSDTPPNSHYYCFSCTYFRSWGCCSTRPRAEGRNWDSPAWIPAIAFPLLQCTAVTALLISCPRGQILTRIPSFVIFRCRHGWLIDHARRGSTAGTDPNTGTQQRQEATVTLPSAERGGGSMAYLCDAAKAMARFARRTSTQRRTPWYQLPPRAKNAGANLRK